MADFLTRDDLEFLVGSNRVSQWFDDDISGSIEVGDETDSLTRILDMAEAEAYTKLRRSWSFDNIVDLVDNDPGLKSHIAWIACHFASERREEFNQDDGAGAFRYQYDRAVKYLDDLSKAKTRSKGEEIVGPAASLGGVLQPTDATEGDIPKFVFARDKWAPSGHGGF